MGAIASQTTSLTIVYSTVYSDAEQRKHQSSTSQAFVRGIHRWPVNSPHKWPVTRKMFPFDDVIMSATPCCQRRSLQWRLTCSTGQKLPEYLMQQVMDMTDADQSPADTWRNNVIITTKWHCYYIMFPPARFNQLHHHNSSCSVSCW